MIYGRREIADRAGRTEAPVLLLTGDSGIGKSTVLRLAAVAPSGWVGSDPLTLASSSGALFQGFLDTLGEVLASLVAEGVGVPSIVDRLTTAGSRLANERMALLARVAAAEVLAVVRGRFGDDLGKAASAYAGNIWPDTAETLAARAASARDPLAVEVLVAFADAAVDLAGGHRLALSFDEGQRLSGDDRRLLADLAERLPGTAHLRLAFSTDNAARRHLVTALRGESPRIEQIEIPPLGEAAVRDWLAAESLPEDLTEWLSRETGGYPLLVEAAIAHLKQGGKPADLPRHEQLAVRTRVSWQALSPRAATVARKLAVLRDPLPDEDLRQLARVDDVGEWATLVTELEEARIFSVEVNGQPWFHRERRAFVLSECLTGEQRAEIAGEAAELVWDKLASAEDFPLAARFAELVADASRLHDAEPHLRAAVALDGPALAVAAALLELATSDGIAVLADSLFSHALRFIDDVGDPVAVLRSLEESGLVQTATSEYATAVGAAWGPMTQAVVQGRTSLLLGKLAIPWLVEAAFALALREPLGEFESARLGIGTPSIGGLGRMAVGLHPEPGLFRRSSVDRRRLGYHLLLRGAVDEQPLYCAATYAGGDARDAAQRVAEGFDRDTPIGRVHIHTAESHPASSIAAQRWVFAAEQAIGRGLPAWTPHDSGEINIPAPSGVSDEDLAERRVQTGRVLRELSTPVEQLALELDRGNLLIWDSGDKYWEECIVQGAGEGSRRDPALATASITERYEGFRIRQALGLGPNQTIAHRGAHYGESPRRDPFLAEIGYRRERARVFNSAQPPLQVVLEEAELKRRIEEGFHAELADARELLRRLSFLGHATLPPKALWALVVLDEPALGFVPGARGMFWYSEGDSPNGEDLVRVEVVHGSAEEGGYAYTVEPDLFTRLFPEARGGGGWSLLDIAIARRLRHHPADITLVWPDD